MEGLKAQACVGDGTGCREEGLWPWSPGWLGEGRWGRGAYPSQLPKKLHYHSLQMKDFLTISCIVDTSYIQFSPSVVSDSLRPHGLQHARPPCLSPTPGVYSNSCPLNRWCHPTISFFVVPFSSWVQSFSASGSFPMSQFFKSDGQSIGISASASVLPMNTQDWSPLGWTGWISLQSKGLSKVFSDTTVQKHQFFSAQLSFYFFKFNFIF